MYSDVTRRTALRLEKPEEAVDIMEMECKQWGKSNTIAHKHLRWGYDASFRGSVKNFILRKEAEVMPCAVLVNAIRVKNQELSTVQDVQGPRMSDTRNDQEIQNHWTNPNFSVKMYGIDREHFTTIRQSGAHLGLANWEIHDYLQCGAPASERGTIQLWALVKKAEKITPAERAGEVHRLQEKLEVLEEVLGVGVVSEAL